MTNQQRREFWRKDVTLPMVYRVLQTDDLALVPFSAVCKIINISGNGFLFLNNQPLEEGTVLDVALILKHARKPLRILCQTVRTLTQRPDGLFPVAVTYRLISQSIQDRVIKEIFEEERREELLPE